MSKKTVHLALVTLVIAALACNFPSAGLQPAATSENIATEATPFSETPQSPERTASAGGGFTPSTAGEAIQHLQPDQIVTVTHIQMIDATGGWALGGLAGNGDHVLRTVDGGITWRDVTPPQPAAPEEASAVSGGGVFLDADAAWITYPSPPDTSPAVSTPLIWRTEDGGQSWQPSQQIDLADPQTPYWPLLMTFVDRQTGWLMASEGAGMGHEYVSFFRSLDGGSTWERLQDPMGMDESSGNLQTCCKSGMDFADAQTGLMTFTPGPNELVLVGWTDDGGQSWRSIQLPPPSSGAGGAEFIGVACGTSSPALFSPSSAVLGVECRAEPGVTEESTWFLYTTDDAGATWRSRPYPGGALQFLTPQVGWALGREIHKTSDGGQTWSEVKTVSWDGQFSFVDERLGWAVAHADDAVALVKTSDGGETWQQITPKIAP